LRIGIRREEKREKNKEKRKLIEIFLSFGI
jgi:hypothetical protein